MTHIDIQAVIHVASVCFKSLFWFVRDGLNLAVFLFQLGLYIKVQLALPLYALLFHIANDTCMHGLSRKSETSLAHV
jgi:hypothetical protein